MSKAGKGKKHSPFTEEAKRNMREGRIGMKFSAEHKRKIGDSQRGAKSSSWKGGITPINSAIRNDLKYKEWRLMVFGRDNFTCQDCGQRGGYLNAHHIKPFALYPALRFQVSNGTTLCRECHNKISTKGIKIEAKIS